MRNILKQSRIQYLLNNRNGYLMLASLSLITNVILSMLIFFMLGYQRIVIVPPSINRDFWVSNNKVSPEYLSEISLFLAMIRFNQTPSNAAMQREVFLRYVEQSAYPKLKTAMIEEEAHLKKEHITTSFFDTDVKADAKKLISEITGDLQYNIGEGSMPSQRVTFRLTFKLSSGRLMLKSVEEVSHHA